MPLEHVQERPERATIDDRTGYALPYAITDHALFLPLSVHDLPPAVCRPA